MTIDNKYKFGDIVYLKTDLDQKPRIVTAILVKPKDLIYELSCGADSSDHFDFEITAERDVYLSTTN